jgi:hypothetical protein
MLNHGYIFRALVLSSAVLYAFLYFLPFESFETDLSRINLLKSDGYAAVLNPQTWLLTIGIFALWIVAYVGLFRFQNWARNLYLVLTIWALFATTLYGIRVVSPMEGVLDLAVNLLDGAILAMAYLSSVKNEFREATVSSS